MIKESICKGLKIYTYFIFNKPYGFSTFLITILVIRYLTLIKAKSEYPGFERDQLMLYIVTSHSFDTFNIKNQNIFLVIEKFLGI